MKLERVSKKRTINTKDFGGFKEVHKEVLDEVDRKVTGRCDLHKANWHKTKRLSKQCPSNVHNVHIALDGR